MVVGPQSKVTLLRSFDKTEFFHHEAPSQVSSIPLTALAEQLCRCCMDKVTPGRACLWKVALLCSFNITFPLFPQD